jgi:hypothetical protein
MARPDESALFAEANNNGQPSDGLMLVFLVELDGEEPPVDPGALIIGITNPFLKPRISVPK